MINSPTGIGNISKVGPAAVIGHRSFIARELIDSLAAREIPIEAITKDSIRGADLSCFYCVYLVLGRARPNRQDELEEMQQIYSVLTNAKHPKRFVYISSMRLTESKQWCEGVMNDIMNSPSTAEAFIVRPPAVFGAGQDIESEMLIPSLIRTDGTVPLLSPDSPAKFISAVDLAEYLFNFSVHGWYGSLTENTVVDIDIPGTFSMTARQMRELYNAFNCPKYRKID